ncbi:tRNA (guanosine(37)-N1)-methyltransferase TrmD [bacterium]|nr:tRNA (guanosine(37)-N1)-methyltransferase TrmD [bacterium]
MIFDIITIFPHIIEEYITQGIVRIAQEKGAVEINIHDLRKWTDDAHKSVDDTPYGGGPGMVMKIEPIYKALEELKTPNSIVCITTPKGEQLKQSKVKEFSQVKDAHYIIICGRYEGVDQRVHENLVDFEFSIGEYILSGGELAALVLVDGITRLLPGVLGNEKSLESESFDNNEELDYPQYTKPEVFNKWKVPEVLLSGHHENIDEWRRKKKVN